MHAVCMGALSDMLVRVQQQKQRTKGDSVICYSNTCEVYAYGNFTLCVCVYLQEDSMSVHAKFRCTHTRRMLQLLKFKMSCIRVCVCVCVRAYVYVCDCVCRRTSMLVLLQQKHLHTTSAYMIAIAASYLNSVCVCARAGERASRRARSS